MMKRILLISIVAVLMVINVGCGHKHTFEEATCTEPKTCTECGETEGDPIGHSWIDATCTEPKTCSVCGVTDGEPNGHSKEVGRCSVCGNIANEELCLMLEQTMVNLSSAGSSAIDATDVDFSSLTVAYTASVLAQPYLDKVSTYSDDLIKLCGDYNELQSLKTATEKLKKTIPSKITGKGQDTIMKWYDKFADYCSASADLYRTYASFAETLKSE